MPSASSALGSRPAVAGVGFVEPTLADWAHLVVDPLESSHGCIFLGPQQAAGRSKLTALRGASPPVNAIVNCTNVFPNHHEGASISYCRIAVNDESGANILVYLDGAATFIHHHVVMRGSSVLVHCQMGVSRSSAVVIAYLMKYRSMSRDEAFVHVKKRRPMINPNDGFWKQLDVFGGRRLGEEKVARKMTPSANVTFDKDWAEHSLATHQTIGHITDDGTDLFPEITGDCNMNDILQLAVDFVFGRGVLEADLPWLSALCRACRALGVDPESLVGDMFADGSDFMDLWSGEVYPNRVAMIRSASLS